MSKVIEKTYLVLAFDYQNDKSDYLYCDDKNQLRSKCNELKEDGYDIMFAGLVMITEDYTKEMR